MTSTFLGDFDLGILETDEDFGICFLACLGLSLAIYVKTLRSFEFYFGYCFYIFAATNGFVGGIGYLGT